MQYGSRPMRSTRRLANQLGQRPAWYSITNAATPELPTQVSIYDEIGFFGVSAGDFLADLKGISGDIQVSINSPGGDVFDGIAIYNQLKQRAGTVAICVDGLAASAASFIAQAASPGKLEMAPHSQMMIHNGFSMAIGDAADLRQTADLLDKITAEIASIYAERSGKPVDYWLAKMSAESWFSDAEAVAEGLADNIRGQAPPAPSKNEWDLSVYGNAGPVVNADGNHGPMKGTHSHAHPAYGSQGTDATHSHEHVHDNDASHGHSHATPGDGQGTGGPPESGVTDAGNVLPVLNASGAPAELGGGWVKDPDGTVRFDPDGDGDDDSTAEGDTDHDYWDADGKQLQDIPACPEPGGAAPGNHDDGTISDSAGAGDGGTAPDGSTTQSEPPPVPPLVRRRPANDRALFPVLGDGTLKPAPAAVPPPVKPRAPDDRTIFPVLNADVDESEWDASKAWAAGAASDDPAKFYGGICAGRKSGDASTQAAWALPYKYSPGSPPNADGVKNALARLPQTKGLTNADEAKATLQKAMKQVNPDYDPDAKGSLVTDLDVIAAAFPLPDPDVDDSEWNPASAMAVAARSPDPARYFAGICAARRHGDPATAEAWALPYKYSPSRPPNAQGVRQALAELPGRTDLANHEQARSVLERAHRAISPDVNSEDDIDPELLAAAFAHGLKGADS